MNDIRRIENILDSISVTHEFDCDEVIFLNTSDVLEGRILIDNFSKVSTLKGQAKKTIQNDDILFSEIRPKNRRYAYVNVPNPSDYVVSTKLMVLRNKTKDVLTKYAYYFLTYAGTLDYLQMRAENRIGSFPQITFDLVKILELKVPKEPIQQKIIDVISSIDSKIENNNQIIFELEKMATTIYNYWFVQFDFPNKSNKPYNSSRGKMKWDEELKMEIPIDWTSGKLSEVANITMGQSPDGDSYNEEGEGMVFFQGSTDFNFRFPIVRMFTTEPSRLAKEEDILLSVRAPVGTINIANENCCIGRGLAALNSKFEANSYLLYLMFYFKTMFDIKNRRGTTFGSIDKDALYDLKFAKPPVELQKQFQSIVGKYDKMILTRSRENQELIALRDFLVPLLMNGQVKVK